MELSHSALRWIFFITFALSHSFLEFFALSRGYGMSMALLFAAIFYLVMACRTDRLRYTFLSLILMLGATFGNLALVNTYLLFIVAILLKFILFPSGNFRKRWLIPLIVIFAGFVPIVFFAKLLMVMQKNGNLYAGSNAGFWKVTVSSLTKMLTYNHHGIFNGFVIFFFILACGLFIRSYSRKGWSKTIDIPVILFFLLIGNILASLALGIMFRVNYPEDRIALYFFILLAGSFLFLLDRALPEGDFHPAILVALPFMFFPLQFLHRMNISYLSVYINDRLPSRFYDKVFKTLTPGDFPPTIGGERGRHFCWSYLNYRHGGHLSEIYYADFPGILADFQIVTTSMNPRWADYYSSIDFDKYSGRELLKRKHPVEKVFAAGSGTISTHGTITNDFFTLYEQSAKPFAGQPLYITLDLSLESEVTPFVSWIVTTVIDSTGAALSYERLPLDWMKDKWTGPGNNLKDVMLVPEIPPQAKTITTYLWNMEKVPFLINNGTVKIFRITP
jgi:MFS family permease